MKCQLQACPKTQFAPTRQPPPLWHQFRQSKLVHLDRAPRNQVWKRSLQRSFVAVAKSAAQFAASRFPKLLKKPRLKLEFSQGPETLQEMAAELLALLHCHQELVCRGYQTVVAVELRRSQSPRLIHRLFLLLAQQLGFR